MFKIHKCTNIAPCLCLTILQHRVILAANRVIAFNPVGQKTAYPLRKISLWNLADIVQSGDDFTLYERNTYKEMQCIKCIKDGGPEILFKFTYNNTNKNTLFCLRITMELN